MVFCEWNPKGLGNVFLIIQTKNGTDMWLSYLKYTNNPIIATLPLGEY